MLFPRHLSDDHYYNVDLREMELANFKPYTSKKGARSHHKISVFCLIEDTNFDCYDDSTFCQSPEVQNSVDTNIYIL